MKKKYYLLSLIFVFFVSVFGQSDNDQDYVDGNQREFIGPKFIPLDTTNEILSNSQLFDTTKNIKNAETKNFSSSIERIKKERNSQRLGSLTKSSQGQVAQNFFNVPDDAESPKSKSCSVKITRSLNKLNKRDRNLLKLKIKNETKDAKKAQEIVENFSKSPRIFLYGKFDKLMSEGNPGPGKYEWTQSGSGKVIFQTQSKKNTVFTSQFPSDFTAPGAKKKVTIEYTCPNEQVSTDFTEFAITIPKTADRVESVDTSIDILDLKRKRKLGQGIQVTKQGNNKVIIVQESPVIEKGNNQKDLFGFGFQNTYVIHDQDGLDMNNSFKGGAVLKTKERLLDRKILGFDVDDKEQLKKLFESRDTIVKEVFKFMQKFGNTSSFINAPFGNSIIDNIFSTFKRSQFFGSGKTKRFFSDHISESKVLFELKHEGIAAINEKEPFAIGIFRSHLVVSFFQVRKDREGRVNSFRLRATYEITDTK